ncbi:MAG TPA: hypothetical protein OIM45_06190 [Clostridiaceae bacterium]|nr:hypothetical protein [Clostridiaceae bacterium]
MNLEELKKSQKIEAFNRLNLLEEIYSIYKEIPKRFKENEYIYFSEDFGNSRKRNITYIK